MKYYWARKIVDNWFHTTTVGKETTILLMHNRQSKFLHLQRQCYYDCGYCYAEAMGQAENKGFNREGVIA